MLVVFNQSPSPPPLQESEALSQGNASDEAETCTKLGSIKHNRVRVRASGYLWVLSSSDPRVLYVNRFTGGQKCSCCLPGPLPQEAGLTEKHRQKEVQGLSVLLNTI